MQQTQLNIQQMVKEWEAQGIKIYNNFPLKKQRGRTSQIEYLFCFPVSY